MHQQCPNCQQMLQIPEQYLGQEMQCPLCKSNFTVPGTPESQAPAAPPPPENPVPPPSTPPAPPPQEQATYGVAEESVPPPPPPPQEPAAPEAPAEPALSSDFEQPPQPSTGTVPPPPPGATPEGGYRRTKTLWISPRVVPWFAPIGLFLAFVLTFFPWMFPKAFSLGLLKADTLNAWQLGFGKDLGSVWFILYALFLVFALVFAVASFLWYLKIIPDLPQLEPIKPLRGWIVAFFTVFSFFCVSMKMLIDWFDAGFCPYSVWAFVAWLFHFIAFIGVMLEVCVQHREPGRPLPRIDFKW